VKTRAQRTSSSPPSPACPTLAPLAYQLGVWSMLDQYAATCFKLSSAPALCAASEMSATERRPADGVRLRTCMRGAHSFASTGQDVPVTCARRVPVQYGVVAVHERLHCDTVARHRARSRSWSPKSHNHSTVRTSKHASE